MKIIGRCKYCKKIRFILKKQAITLPTGERALSKEDMCSKCANIVNKVINIR
jgi:hypothetical protein